MPVTRENILKKAFNKAKQNGYTVNLGMSSMEQVVKYGIFYKFIFSHDFAKAFFVPVFKGGRMVIKPDSYLDNLAEMVKEKDPIKYLKKHL